MGAQIDGQMRIHFVRSVAFAEQEGHSAIASYLKQYGSWGHGDDALRGRPFVLHTHVHFRYEEAFNNWRVRQMKLVPGSDWVSVGSSDFLELYDLSDESEEYESGEDEHDEYDSGQLYNAWYDTDYITQAWLDDTDLVATGPSDLNTRGIQPTAYGSALSQMPATQRVIEVDDMGGDVDVVQSDVGFDSAQCSVDFNMPSMALADNRATDQVELWEPGGSWR